MLATLLTMNLRSRICAQVFKCSSVQVINCSRAQEEKIRQVVGMDSGADTMFTAEFCWCCYCPSVCDIVEFCLRRTGQRLPTASAADSRGRVRGRVTKVDSTRPEVADWPSLDSKWCLGKLSCSSSSACLRFEIATHNVAKLLCCVCLCLGSGSLVQNAYQRESVLYYPVHSLTVSQRGCVFRGGVGCSRSPHTQPGPRPAHAATPDEEDRDYSPTSVAVRVASPAVRTAAQCVLAPLVSRRCGVHSVVVGARRWSSSRQLRHLVTAMCSDSVR